MWLSYCKENKGHLLQSHVSVIVSDAIFFGVSLAICPHHCSPTAEVSPDCNNLAPIKRNAVHLSNEDGCHGLVQCSPIHVDGGAHWEHETRHSLVDAQVLLQASKRDRQSTGTEERKFIIHSLFNDNPTPKGRSFVAFYKDKNKTWSLASVLPEVLSETKNKEVFHKGDETVGRPEHEPSW